MASVWCPQEPPRMCEAHGQSGRSPPPSHCQQTAQGRPDERHRQAELKKTGDLDKRNPLGDGRQRQGSSPNITISGGERITWPSAGGTYSPSMPSMAGRRGPFCAPDTALGCWGHRVFFCLVCLAALGAPELASRYRYGNFQAHRCSALVALRLLGHWERGPAHCSTPLP